MHDDFGEFSHGVQYSVFIMEEDQVQHEKVGVGSGHGRGEISRDVELK